MLCKSGGMAHKKTLGKNRSTTGGGDIVVERLQQAGACTHVQLGARAWHHRLHRAQLLITSSAPRTAHL